MVNINSCDIALRWAVSKTIETNGIVCLPVSINNQEIQVSLYVLLKQLTLWYLTANFWKNTTLFYDFVMIEENLNFPHWSKTRIKPKPALKLDEPLQLSPYSNCFTECSVNIIPGLRGTYLVEPNNALFAEKGILISRGVVAVGSGRLIISIANVTSSEVTLESDETLDDW